jgi:hypothetical protein
MIPCPFFFTTGNSKSYQGSKRNGGTRGKTLNIHIVAASAGLKTTASALFLLSHSRRRKDEIFRCSMALLLQKLLVFFKRQSFEGKNPMGYLATTARKLKGLIDKVVCYSWLISASSLVWFLLRTGINPSRYGYPCQEVARTNIAVFGLPLLYFFIQRFKKCPRFRARFLYSIFLVALGLVLAGGGGMWVRNDRLVRISPPVQKVYAATKSRVVWISDSRATNGYNQSWSNKASQPG